MPKIIVDEDTIIGELLDRFAALEDVFLDEGMTCMHCPSARCETIGEACGIHGVDVGWLLERIRNHPAVQNQTTAAG